MKKLLPLLLLLLSVGAFAQEDAWVYFNEKPNADMYLSNPLQMLSQRALDRRANQNIPLDIKDVPVSQSFIDQVDAATGISVMAKSKWLNAVHVRGTFEDILLLNQLPFVSAVDFANNALDFNFEGRAARGSSFVAVNKALDVETVFSYGNSNNQIEMLNGHLLHQQDFTGTGKVIAILDAGFPNVNIAQPFQRLFDNNLILGGYNFVNRNEDIYSANNHGTLVLSTIGGYVENQLVGTAPDASYYLFVTEDVLSENPIEESLWVEAAEMADSLGADIINTSLGYFTYDNPNYSYTYEDMNGNTSFISRGADIAFSRGMIVVVSAGNSGTSQNPHITAPADAFNVLAVGAVDASSQYADFSSIGASFDGRIKPDVMAQGSPAVVSNAFGVIGTASGTSFSAPVTTGLVACLWQALPEKTNAEIVQLIKESAHLYSTPNDQYGYGIPDFASALESALTVDPLTNNEFLLFPNPANERLSLLMPEGFKTAEILFFNSLGQLVLQHNFSANTSIAIGNLNPGVYFYHLTSGSTTQSGKLIKK